MDLFYVSPLNNGTSIAYIWQYFNAGIFVDYSFYIVTPTSGQKWDDLDAAATAAAIAYATAHSYTVTNTQLWTEHVQTLITAALPVAPSSYQTIVSQVGTAVPAVTSGFTPLNTYAGAPTFTWARTSAGVYTLTASTAVFNVANGKTAVFISPLSNPLSNIVYTVTSTTVITFTTSTLNVVSLLLGATATDALLSKTMIYVQTYA